LKNPWLIAGGVLSAAAALLHLAIIVGGPGWYRFFGAGERMARAAERGEPMPAMITVGIAVVLAIWAAYAFAGAGLLPRLPLMRTALVTISAVYLLRGFAPLLAIAVGAALTPTKVVVVAPSVLWSSLIVSAYGLSYGVGTWRAWPALGRASI
jgi:hypothetical protein